MVERFQTGAGDKKGGVESGVGKASTISLSGQIILVQILATKLLFEQQIQTRTKISHSRDPRNY